MEEQHSGAGALACGIVGLVLGAVSYIVCGWLSFIGLPLGIVGLCLPTPGFGKKVPALLAAIVSGIATVIYVISLIVIYS
ncbi:hypothetical protein [Paratractidigestivibacter sp.]|uniref:hypothetical protein n=1 Tax=Paratractidigestivibacter sp. TaxID=2847316 RepID=UPI002AC91B68|nr:hypothetical protein [Paratractidigestivibacter sp.]